MFNRDSCYQTIVFVFCVLFGIAMILNALCTADGVWFGYATLFNHGVKLYSQLHLILQPLIVLETAWFMRLLGDGWLVSKIPAVLHVVVYTLAIFAIVRQLPLTDRQRAVLMGAAFFLTVNTVAYRFDDYHVVAETFALFSIAVLLKLYRSYNQTSNLGLVALLGAFSGLAIETRINDGAALFLAAGIAIFSLVRNRRLISLACLTAAAALTIVIVVRLTGDSFHDYWVTSFIGAAGSKGGVGNVLLFPLQMPWTALLLLRGYHRAIAILTLFVGGILFWVYLVLPAILSRTKRAISVAAVVAVLILADVFFLYNHGLKTRIAILSVSTVALLLIYAFGMIASVRLVVHTFMPNWLSEWNPLEILFLVPLGLLASAAMSSGGRIGEFYVPFAILMLLLPIASPFELRLKGRELLFAAAAILFVFGCLHRVKDPLSWLNAVNEPMFVNRTWYRHPVYGPMYIQRDMLAFIQPVCKTVGSDGSSDGFLSLPYSYANYFCAIPPWHDHVQTWYDTSSKANIDGLIEELQHAPPKWIFYQSQPETLRLNEAVFNRGQPIPYRFLDQLIMQKVDNGSWKVAYRSDYGGTREWSDDWLGEEWFLIQTRP